MVSKPSGLLTCLVRFSALRTLSRLRCAWALGLCWLLIAFNDAAAAAGRTVLVLGDSLSAGYGLKPTEGWVALLEKRLQGQAYGYRVVNASVSGETSGGGLQRVPRTPEVPKAGRGHHRARCERRAARAAGGADPRQFDPD